MDLLEYQGKQVLAAHGAPVSQGVVADSVDEAEAAAETLGYPVVLKAQVPVGGRGKAGAIRVATSAGAARDHAAAIFGLSVRGHPVRRLWLERAADIAHEYYASLTFDRAARRHLLLVSARGGIDIETVAAEDPDAIVRRHVDPLDDLSAEVARDVVDRAGLHPPAAAELAGVLLAMWSAYRKGDAELVEVNPLVVTAAGQVVALDAKVILDDSAAFRHPEWSEWRAGQLLDDRERLAREKGLNYIGLTGTVGIIGNGAGLVMSTLDVVNEVEGTAANFLDIGGGAGADLVAAALDVVNSDPNVRAILVNIFGGITRGDLVAQGIVEALERVELRSPIIVRLDGTNAEEGRAILAGHASPQLLSEPTMLAAARRAVEVAAQGAT